VEVPEPTLDSVDSASSLVDDTIDRIAARIPDNAGAPSNAPTPSQAKLL
jgi:hypothetical protein